jgi:hypothetical protein
MEETICVPRSGQAARSWWLTPVILSIWKVEIGGSWFKTRPGK